MATQSSRGRARHSPSPLLTAIQDAHLVDRRKAKRIAAGTAAVVRINKHGPILRGNDFFSWIQKPANAYSSLINSEGQIPTDEVVNSWFEGLPSDATDAGNPVPNQHVVEETKRIVLGLRPYLSANSDVYTMEDGKIAVEIFGSPGRGFLLICEPGGSALCIVNVEDAPRRARYESSTVLPDGFLFEGLQAVLSTY